MIYPTEKIYSKAQARKRLGISRARYEQFILSGILPEPIAITEGSRPIHTESQIRIAESNLYERACSTVINATRPIRPLSENIRSLVRKRALTRSK